MFKQKLKDVKLYKEDNTYFLDITYLEDTDLYVKEVNIPKVLLPINDTFSLDYTYNSEIDSLRITTKVELNLPFDVKLPVYKKGASDFSCLYGHYFTEKIIKETAKEMTLSEIEKKLGHKVKLISEEKKND